MSDKKTRVKTWHTVALLCFLVLLVFVAKYFFKQAGSTLSKVPSTISLAPFSPVSLASSMKS